MKPINRIMVTILLTMGLLAACQPVTSEPSDPSDSTSSQDQADQSIEAEGPTDLEPQMVETEEKETNCLPQYDIPNEFLHLNPPAELWSVESADFNDDGLIDILLPRGKFQSGEPFEMEILLNDGQGSFYEGNEEVFSGNVPTSVEPREVVLADFNSDGRMDIFIADNGKDADPFPGHQNTLVLSANDGKMVDATNQLPQQSDQSHSATAADIDADGDIDLFIGNLGGGSVSPQLLINAGDGTFSVDNTRLPAEHIDLWQNWYTSCLFTDINNDSVPDLILGQGEINKPSYVLINDGTGQFSNVGTPLPPAHFAPEQQIVDIAAGDIDGDDFADLILADTHNSYTGGGYAQVLINNQDNTFSDQTDQWLDQNGDSGSWIIRTALIDLNMDERLDLAVSLMGGSGPRFYLNEGNSHFTPQSNVLKIETSNLFTLFDINEDGFLDVFWSFSRNGGIPEIHFTVMALGCR